MQSLCSFYEKDLNCAIDVAVGELHLWYRHVSQMQTTTKFLNGFDYINICNKEVFSNIYTLLKIFITIPVSTTTPERSFSTLKILKTYLRNTISENRLNGLALLYIYKHENIQAEEVLEQLANKPRKLDFRLK